MRIISKHRDYYDSVMAYGHDDQFIYMRNTQEVKYDYPENIKLKELCADVPGEYVAGRYHSKLPSVQLKFHIIGFCGKIFPCIEFETRVNRSLHSIYKTHHVYTYEAFCKGLAEYQGCGAELVDSLNAGEDVRIKRFFSKWSGYSGFSELFSYLNVPIFQFYVSRGLYDPYYGIGRNERKLKVSTNPNLSDFGFVRVADPYIAFQEIEMFIGGVLGVASQNIIEVSDECKRDAKGFDKRSFKTCKGDKKPRSRNRGK